MLKKSLLFIVLTLLFVNILPLMAQETVLLERDQTIPVRGAVFSITFRGGTQADLDENGEVIRGTIVYDQILPVSGGDYSIKFQEGTIVEFDEDGEVLRGVPAYDQIIPVSGGDYSIKFQEGSVVEFDGSGEVLRGVLAYDQILPVSGGDYSIKFQEGSVVEFDGNGEVLRGILAGDQILPVSGGDYSIKFQRGTIVEFDGDGEVFRGTIAGDQILPLRGVNSSVTFQSGSEVRFEDGFVINFSYSGNFPNLEGIWYIIGPWNEGMKCEIIQDGEDLTLINELGEDTEGYFYNIDNVVATSGPGWGDGVVGSITDNGTCIKWPNGTLWSRTPPTQSNSSQTAQNNSSQTGQNNSSQTGQNNSSQTGQNNSSLPNLNGYWHSLDDDINKWQIIQNGENLTLISPTGDSTEGYFHSKLCIVVPAWNTYADLSYSTVKPGVPLYITWKSGVAWKYCEE